MARQSFMFALPKIFQLLQIFLRLPMGQRSWAPLRRHLSPRHLVKSITRGLRPTYRKWPMEDSITLKAVFFIHSITQMHMANIGLTPLKMLPQSTINGW